MIRKITSSIAVVLALLLSLTLFASVGHGQTAGENVNLRKVVAKTGVLTPAVGQTLRITVAGGGKDAITIRFAWKRFVGGTCSAVMGATVCRHTVASGGTSAPVMLGRNEAASLDIPGDGNGVEVMVFNNDGDPVVQCQIIDSQGNVVTVFVPDSAPPDTNGVVATTAQQIRLKTHLFL